MKKFIAVLLSAGLMAQISFAEPFRILGARALGMGGAQVAVIGDSIGSSDADTQYWNPAALGLHQGTDIAIPVNVNLEATGGILNYVKDISDSASQFSEINDAQQNGAAIDLKQVKAFSQALTNLQKLNKQGLGMLVGVNSGMNGAYGRWGISGNYFASIGVSPQVNLSNLGLGSFSPRRFAIAAAASYDGIDMSNLTSLGTTTNIATLIANPSDAALQGASTKLETTVAMLQADANLNLGGYTAQQIANVLVNVAAEQGVTTDEIVSSVNTIEENRPLIQSLINSATGTSGFASNDSNVTLKGIIYNEIALGHGRDSSYISDSLKDLYLGLNLKYMQGTVGYIKQKVFDEGTGKASNLLDDLKKNVQDSSSFGVDMGILYDMKAKYKSRAGLLLRNINSPSFNQPQAAIDAGVTGSYKIEPQVRAGLAVWPYKPLTLAVDYDLTENKTAIDGFNSRLISGGLEYNLFNKRAINLALRGGLMKNLASSESSTVYTGGIGLNLIHFVIDITGAISSDTVELDDGTKVPSSGAVNLSLGFNF